MAKIKIAETILHLGARAKTWIKQNPTEAAVLFLILLVSAFLRLYKISEYMTFLGDEGRDVIIVRRLLVNADPILIGPGTSIGNIYLGPIYYYMMAPALFLAGYSPAGPAIMIALLGVITTFFVWWVAREWFSQGSNKDGISIAAAVAAGLYAVSPSVIIFSRSSWNPNIMPFFALLCIYSTWQFWQKHKFPWIVVFGISLAFVLQSHYLGLLLVPVTGFFWLLTFLKLRFGKNEKGEIEIGKFLRNSLVSLVVFLGLMSPLVIFDARHGWQNFAAIKKFFLERQETVSARPWKALPKAWPVFQKFVFKLVGGNDNKVGTWAGIILVATTLYGLFTKKPAYLIIFFWLGLAVLGLSLYKQEIYDHYYGFFFAAPFLLFGGLSQEIVNWSKKFGRELVGLFVVAMGFFLLAYVNLKVNPLRSAPGRQLQRTMEVSGKIQKEAGDKRFNLAVIAERNYEDAYQYFLENWNTKVTKIDPQSLDKTVGEYLFVVCELPKEKCDPTHNPKAEVANFGWSKVESQWEVGGVILYKLVHAT